MLNCFRNCILDLSEYYLIHSFQQQIQDVFFTVHPDVPLCTVYNIYLQFSYILILKTVYWTINTFGIKRNGSHVFDILTKNVVEGKGNANILLLVLSTVFMGLRGPRNTCIVCRWASQHFQTVFLYFMLTCTSRVSIAGHIPKTAVMLPYICCKIV